MVTAFAEQFMQDVFRKGSTAHMLSTLCSNPLAGDSKTDTGTL